VFGEIQNTPELLACVRTVIDTDRDEWGNNEGWNLSDAGWD